MERMRIAALFADRESLDGKEVVVCGWARTIRDMKGFGFIELNDGSCFKNLQVVLDASVLDNYKEIARSERGRSPGRCTGTVVLTPEAKQPLEVKASRPWRWRARPPRTIPCRKSATAWSSCAPSSTCGPGPTCSPPPSGCAPWQPTPVH